MFVDMVLKPAADSQPDEWDLEEIGKGDLPLCRQVGIAGHGDDQSVCREWTNGNVPCVDRIRDDTHIRQPACHRLYDLGAGSFLEVEVNVWMQLEKTRQPLGQYFGHGCGIGQDPDRTASPRRVLADLADEMAHLLQHEAGMMSERLAGGRQGDASASTIDQTHPGIGFHADEAFARGSQRHMRSSGAMRDAAGIRDTEKQAKVSEVEPHMETIALNEPSAQPKANSSVSAFSGGSVPVQISHDRICF
ncbi:hypothetical protein V5F26_05390 [Xanthobacter sp. V4C-8]